MEDEEVMCIGCGEAMTYDELDENDERCIYCGREIEVGEE